MLTRAERPGEEAAMEKRQRVLIVEDEKNIVDILRFNLRKEGRLTPKRPTTERWGWSWPSRRPPT